LTAGRATGLEASKAFARRDIDLGLWERLVGTPPAEWQRPQVRVNLILTYDVASAILTVAPSLALVMRATPFKENDCIASSHWPPAAQHLTVRKARERALRRRIA
jgi:hypothetical protein